MTSLEWRFRFGSSRNRTRLEGLHSSDASFLSFQVSLEIVVLSELRNKPCSATRASSKALWLDFALVFYQFSFYTSSLNYIDILCLCRSGKGGDSGGGHHFRKQRS